MAFFEYFHQLAKNHEEGRPPVPRLWDDWPDEWKRIEYKTYPDLSTIELPRAHLETRDVFSLIAHRSSTRAFTQQAISKSALASLLLYTCGIPLPLPVDMRTEDERAKEHRSQPSGGGRFPIEAYVLNFIEGEIPAGVFHYDVRNHGLHVLEKRAWSGADIEASFVYPYVKDAACALVLTAVFERTTRKYGERGYRYALLEAGHIGQNISLVAPALGLSACMTGTHDAQVEHVLDVDGVSESIVYAAVIGA